MTWESFLYRDFHDRPRLAIVRHQGVAYILDSRFNDELDEYEPDYTVYEATDLPDKLLADSWDGILERIPVTKLGKAPVSSVLFDPTFRKQIDVEFLGRLQR